MGKTAKNIEIVISDSYKLTKAEMVDIMLKSDPWRTLGTTEKALADLEKALPGYGVLAATANGDLVGFVITQSNFLSGEYLRLIAVKEGFRSQGIGAKLMDEFEARTFKKVPNAYLCVSSFNTKACEFYIRRGYSQIGILEKLIMPEYDELLMRKTVGPRKFFKPV